MERSNPPWPTKYKYKIIITYETKTLVVYVSLEQLVFLSLTDKKHARKIKNKNLCKLVLL